jgi:ligand-binding sensor domain-containing protein
MKVKLLLLFIIINYGVEAQIWKHYDVSNSSSPYNDYTRMAIDTGNAKWFVRLIGSGDKTVSFDNNLTWTVYNNVFNTTAFNCRVIRIDKKNKMWQSTLNNDAYSFDSGVWTKYNSTTTGLSLMSSINDFVVDQNNLKWFCSNLGLANYNDTVFNFFDTANSNLPFQPIYKININASNYLYIIGQDSLSIFNGSVWNSYSTPFSSVATSINTYKLACSSSNSIWLARSLSNDGLYKFENGFWINFTTSNSNLPSNSISSIAIDSDDNIWFSYAGGLAKFDGTNCVLFDTLNGFPYQNGGGVLQIDKFNNKWNCSPNGVVVFNESGVVGIEEYSKNKNLNVYPNPTKEGFTIRLNDNFEKKNILITNQLGQKIYSVDTFLDQFSIEFNNNPNGVYLLQINDGVNVYYERIVKQ